MNEDETPNGPPREAGEPWVTGAPNVGRRVPGINETQEATYVDPESASRRRAVLIGTGIGLVVTAIFATVMLSTDSNGGSRDAAVGAGITASSSTTRSTTTTTGVEWWRRATTTTTAPPAAAAPSTSPPASALASAATPATPATPRATSDPAAPPYAEVEIPLGMDATITSCAWQPANGGQYEAAGTVTNGPSTNHGWTLTIHWLQNHREIGTQSTFVALTAGQSASWSRTLSAPTAPADPFSCALTAA